ncbi:MAG: LpxI family protein, partial [Lentisphaerae bacterium]
MKVDLQQPLGIIAGKGQYPLLLAREARAHGVNPIVAVGFHGDTDEQLANLVEHFQRVYVGQLNKLIRVFKDHGVRQVIMAGQVTPGRLFKGLRPDWRAIRMLSRIHPKNAETVFGELIRELAKDGLEVLPATTFLEEHLAAEGVLGKRKPSRAQLQDIEFGIRIGREVSALDIGQTVVVKNGVVLAVEAFEGTDAAIRRGGELGRGDVVVVKLAKSRQDYRFDVPCVGLQTVESLKNAGAAALAVEAGITLFLNKEEVVNE